MPAKIDISGQRYGYLTVLYDSGKRKTKKRKIIWHCKCDCGNEVDVDKFYLTRSKSIPSCGCMSKKKGMYVGYQVGRLTVTKELGSNGKKKLWECTCECGNKVIHSTAKLNFGKTRSCGCLKLETGEKLKKYNARDRKLYIRWNNIQERCYNPNNSAYKNYGGRGIKMCPEWEHDFYSFRDWAIQNGYDESLSIDRIDNNKDYSPDNCRWTNDKNQCNNRRSNHYITIDGVTKTMMEWSEYYGIKYETVQSRLERGWLDVDAVSKPVRPKKPTGQGARYKINHPNQAYE